MFTWRHLLWLIICFAAAAAMVFLYRKKRPSMDRILTAALILSILSEITKVMSLVQLVPSADGMTLVPYLTLNHLPLHFCSVQVILIACARFSRSPGSREALLAFMAPTCALGGCAALLMPSIFSTTVPVEHAFVSPVSYQFFVFHTTLVCLGLIIAQSGEVVWQWKRFTHTLLFVYLMGFVSIYLNSILSSPSYVDGTLAGVDAWTNFFFTCQNPLGIRLFHLWQWYLYLIILAGLAALLLFLFHWPLVHRNRHTRSSAPSVH